MIDTGTLDRPATVAAAETTLRGLKSLDGDVLLVAAHWADLHDPASLTPLVDRVEERRRRLNGDYGVQLGGEGTPEVLASCLAELGVALETSIGGARHLVADALDLRHRLPRLWAQVMDGRTRSWRARQVAVATRRLPLESMAEVDAGLAEVLGTLSWARFALVLEATVKRASPHLSRAQEEEAAARRFVGVGRANDQGIATLIARGTALDVQTFLAAVKRIADILGAEGDTDPADVRRSKAVGILGQPARALALLTLHREDPDPVRPAEPDTDPGPGTEVGSRSLDLSPLAGADPGWLARLAGAGPRVQLYVHLTEAALTGLDPRAVARVEGIGPITAATVRAWLRRPDVSVTLRPVVVPGHAIPVDAYEIPPSVRQAVRLRSPAACSRGRVARHRRWTWTTSRPTGGWPRAARRVRPGRTDWGPSPAASTAARPAVDGRPGALHRACSSGGRPTAGSISSPTRAPSR